MKAVEQTLDMLVDYINQRADCLRETRQSTAKKYVIVLSDEKQTEIPGYAKSESIYVPFGNFNELTVKMAKTFGDLAGVVFVPSKYDKTVSSADLRRIRQLTSAEGAVMIWDDLETKAQSEVSRLKNQVAVDIFLEAPKLQEMNQYETEFIYKEIFENKTYLKHGLTIPAKAVVVDIGANIGLFSMFAKTHSPDSEVYAFEPSKEVFEVLSQNTKAFGASVKRFNMGVGGKSGTENFTFYPGYSVISGFHADRMADEAVIKSGESFKEQPAAPETISARFDQQKTYPCEVTTVSEIIKLNNLNKIDFLKIDAEKSESQIIQGISPNDWSLISQIVVEVHGTQTLQEIENFLKVNGFHTISETAIVVADSTIYTIYGKKNAGAI